MRCGSLEQLSRERGALQRAQSSHASEQPCTGSCPLAQAALPQKCALQVTFNCFKLVTPVMMEPEGGRALGGTPCTSHTPQYSQYRCPAPSDDARTAQSYMRTRAHAKPRI